MTWILDFLADLFEQGLEHSTIAGYRSAISSYHDSVDGCKAGEHPLVNALLKGVFNNTPRKPIYTFIWDVESVISYIKSLPGDCNLSDKLLMLLKLAMLVALTTASRVSEICYLDINFLQRRDSGYIFYLSKLSKTCRMNKPRPTGQVL